MFKSTKSYISILLIALLVGLLWLAWPVYEFYAHKGPLPMPPYGFLDQPDDTPIDNIVAKSEYRAVADQANALLIEHRKKINVPALSAAVAINGKQVWAGAVGWADIATRKPVTTNTQFRIGSSSKALTATGLARLVDKGVIELDTPISRYLTNSPNPKWQTITSRLLASHMSGLPHYKENTDIWGVYQSISLNKHFDDVRQAVKLFDDSELLFKPGSDYSYSTYGIVLLSAVMQQATGNAYLDIMQNQVFSPLEMNATLAEPQDNKPTTLATFYWNNKGRSSQFRPWREVDLSHRLAGGGLISTPSDLVKLGNAYLKNTFISDDTRNVFWTPQHLPGGEVVPTSYALGWRAHQMELHGQKTTIINHGGVSRGAQSWLMIIPEYSMVVAVNINAKTDVFWDFGAVSMQLAKLFSAPGTTDLQVGIE